MSPFCSYPGSFSPPTYGHARIVQRAAAIFQRVTVVCSTNPEKRPTFSPEEAVKLWKAYDLPSNVDVMTFEQAHAVSPKTPDGIVMIRGLRSANAVADEANVVMLNHKQFGISNFHFILAEPDMREVSSTAARNAAIDLDLETLAGLVAPCVVTALLKRMLNIAGLHVVCGQSGSGKSTVLAALQKLDPRFVHIDTDRFLDDTKEELKQRFGTQDLVSLATERGEELKAAVKDGWMARLRNALTDLPFGCHAMVEVPYALNADMRLYRQLGGSIVNFFAPNGAAEQRLHSRGTPQHVKLLGKFPDWDECGRIVQENRLLQYHAVTTIESPEKVAEDVRWRLLEDAGEI